MSDKPAYAINEWCVETRVSPSFYFKEHKNGRGPRVARMARRTIIIESPRAFFKRFELESTPQAADAPAVEAV